jgi:hypothetical protein
MRRGRPYKIRVKVSPYKTQYEILQQDIGIRAYWADLSTDVKPVSLSTIRKTLVSCMRFLEILGKPVTTTAISELIEFKRKNRDDTSLERTLKLARAEGTLDTNYVACILGLFRRNYARLDLTVHCSSSHRTIPISEPILRAIRLDPDLNQEERDAIDLMTYGAERLNALSKLPIENVHLVEDSNVVLLDVPAHLAKTGVAHPSIIPKELAERLLERATTLGYKTLFPSNKTRWRHITKLAQAKYHVLFTSHYLRKRFETLAERIPANEMNPNHWIILMGSKPKLGHMPEIYSLLSDRELVHEYETYLLPCLALSGDSYRPQSSKLEILKRENAELKEQLAKLARLLTERA